MKKNLLGKIAVLFGLAFFALFTGCENFLNSDTVKDEITEIIAYNNAPSYVIRVEVDNDTGSLKAPVTGEVTKKVTDVFPVKFAPKSGYQFVRWEAVFTNDRMQNEDIRNYIEFEDENNLETNVTFKRASDSIEIRPVCPKKFTVELESPDTTKSASTPKDTSIVLKFNNPLDPACIEGEWPDWDDEETEWSNTEWAKMFDISISGIDDSKVMSYFKKPVLDASGTRLIIAPDLSVKDGRTNYIPDLENGNKTLTITLNQQYFYYQFTIDKYSKLPEKVTLESPFTKTFVINNETNQKTSVIFKLDDDNTKGRFKVDEKAVDGESHKYSVGKDINLVYNPESGYVFDGWYATYIEKNEQNESVEKQAKLTADILSNYNLSMSYPSDEATFGVNPLTDEARLCLTVLSYSENVITIEPKNKPMVNFSFMPDDDGTGNFMVDEKTYQSAANQYSVSKTIKLKYTPNKKDEYYFDYWLITRTYKDDTGVTKTESIKIKAPESQTAVNPLEAVKDFNLSLTFAEDEEYYGINQDTNVAQAQLSVDDYIDGTITIKPVNKPRVKVSFELDYGNEPDVAPGTLSVNEKSIDSQAGEYSVDKTIKLKYKPSTGFDFDHWLFTRTYKDSTGKVQTQSFTISNMDATTEPAKFKLSIDYAEDEITRPLITINGSVDGSIVIKPVNKLRQNLKFITDTQTGTFSVDEKNLVGDQSEKYSVGKTIKLKYKPADGYIFSHWQFKLGNEEVSSLDAQNLKDKLKLDITYPEGDTTLAVITISDYKAGEITVKPVNKSRDKITFAVQEENGTATGTLTVDEKSLENQVHEYSVDKTIKLKYKPADGYFFAHWQFKLGDTVTNVRDITSSDLAALNSTMGLELSYPDDEPTQAVITVKNYKAGEIVITPINKSRDKITFAVQEENGTAAGTFTVDEKSLENQAHEYSVGKDISLKYKPADGYLFSHWEFKSGTTKVLVQNGSQTELAALSSVFGFEVSYPEEGNLARIILSIKDAYDGTVVVTPVNQARVRIQFKQQNSNNGTIENNNTNTINFEDYGKYRIDDSDCDTQIHKYSVGKTLNLTYRLTSSDYYFMGWIVKKVYENAADNEEYSQSDFTNENLNRFGLTVSYNDNDSDYGYDSATKTAQVSITIQEYKNDALIVIEPVIVQIPSALVTLDGTHGKFSPAKGIYNTKEKVYSSISFDPDGDYEFIRWQIYDITTDNELNNADYITIKDPKSKNTSYALVKVPDPDNVEEKNIQLGIRPVVHERPQILSYSPMYNATGTFIDTSIQVMFDYDMDERSIYYTSKELTELRNKLEIAEDENWFYDSSNNPIRGLLYFDKNEERKYYGYWDESGSYFKNITIKNNTTETSLNEYFENPSFDTPRTLSIRAKQYNLPPAYTQIAVTIERDFFYLEPVENKEITLNSSKKWIYQVNASEDEDDPEVVPKQFAVKYKDYNGDWQSIRAETSVPYTESNGYGWGHFAALRKDDDGKLKLYLDTDVVIADNLGISPTFDIVFKRVFNNNYQEITYPPTYTRTFEYALIAGNSACLPEYVDVSDLPDGIYSFQFEFTDLSRHKVSQLVDDGNPSSTSGDVYCNTHNYYVAIDRTAPVISTPPSVVDYTVGTNPTEKQNYLRVLWNYDILDLRRAIIRYKADEAVDYQEFETDYNEITKWFCAIDPNNGHEEYSQYWTHELQTLDNGTHYSFDVIFEDYAGNQTTYNCDGFTKPAMPTVTSNLDNMHETDFALEYSMPAETYFNKTRVRYREYSETDWIELNNEELATSLTQEITGLENAKRYTIELCSYDDRSNKYSIPYTLSNKSLPMYVTRPEAATLRSFKDYNDESYPTVYNTDKVEFYYNKPVCSELKLRYSLTEDFADYEEVGLSDDSEIQTLSLTPDGDLFEPGTDCYIKFITRYYTNNNITESEVYKLWTKTEPCTSFGFDNSKTEEPDKLNLKWTPPTSNFNSYLIRYKPANAGNDSWQEIVINDKTLTKYTITGLTGGTTYTHTICTRIDSNDRISKGTGGNTSTKCSPVTNVTVEQYGDINQSTGKCSVKLTWTQPDPNSNYGYINLFYATSTTQINDSIRYARTPSTNLKGLTTTTIGGLTPGETYYFCFVTFTDGSYPNSGTKSEIVSLNTSIAPVKSPSVTIQSSTSVKLAWTNPSGTYTGLRIKRNNSTLATITNQSTTSYTDSTCSPNTQYTYSIETYNDEGKTSSASAGTITTPATAISTFYSDQEDNTETSVKLKWTNPSNTNYWNEVKIYSVSGSTENCVATITDHTTNEYSIDNLAAATAYTYRIRTTNTESALATAKECTAKTSLNGITNLTLSSVTTDGATYTWTNPAGEFNLTFCYRISSASTWTEKTLTAGSTSYSITGLYPGLIYQAKVKVSKDGWISKESSVSKFSTRPNAAENFRVTGRTETSLTFTWTKPEGNFSYYYLYYKKSSASAYTSQYIESKDTTSYTITGLDNSTIYNAYLKTIPSTTYASYSSATSTITNITTPVFNTITGVKVRANYGYVTVSWDKPVGPQSRYRVYYKKTNDTEWNYSNVTNSNTLYKTFTGLDKITQYDFKVVAGYYNSRYDIEVYHDEDSEIVSFYTPPPAVTSATIISDDGMGTITVKYKNPTYPNGKCGVDFFVGDTYVGYLAPNSNPSGSTKTATIIIPNYTRGVTYTISFRPYHGLNTRSGETAAYAQSFPGETYAASCDISLTNSTGKIKINESTDYFDYSQLNRVISSETLIDKNSTGGSFTSSNSINLTPYSIGAYEVTCELFDAVMGTEKSGEHPYYPATGVSWYAAIAFCNKLSAMLGLTPCYTIGTISNSSWKTFSYDNIPTSSNDDWNNAICDFSANGYHLPTEYQWECAARGGDPSNTTVWNYEYAGSNTGSTVASGSNTNVGSKPSNTLDLYDMTGSVWELTNDWGNGLSDCAPPAVSETDFTVTYSSSYRGTCTNMVYKGGSSSAYKLTKRLICQSVTFSNWDLGFRVCRNKTYQ